MPALPGPDRGGGPCILGNVKWWSGSTLLDYGRKVNKLTASEVLVQVKKLVDSGKWDKKKKRSRFSPCLLYFFCVCIYYRGGVGWGGGYLRAYSFVALLFADTYETRAAKGACH